MTRWRRLASRDNLTCLILTVLFVVGLSVLAAGVSRIGR